MNRKIALGLALVASVLALLWWSPWQKTAAEEGLVGGNGRLEATEVLVCSRLSGRLVSFSVEEGDFVAAGQTVAQLEQMSLVAQRDEAIARVQQAREALAAARQAIAARVSEQAAAQARVTQRQNDWQAAERSLQRTRELAREGFFSRQRLDDDATREQSQRAVLTATRAEAAAAAIAIAAARAQMTGAEANVSVQQAALRRVEVDLAETNLKAPREGRVQYRVAQPGEVLAAGARVLSLVDVSDVYFTFFLPEVAAGRLALGSEVRIVLDATPERVIPARVSFVASVAQFTPKTVETASERQKLVFRVRAQVAPALLRQHRDEIKSGLPGVAFIKLDDSRPWPKRLALP